MLAKLLCGRVDTAVLQGLLDLEGGTEGGDQNHVVGGDLVLGNLSLTVTVVDETNAAAGQVVIHEGIVDNLAQQVDLPVGMPLEGRECHMDGPLHTETESEVAWHQHLEPAQGQNRGRQRAFALVLTEILDTLNHLSGIVIRHAVELPESHGTRIYATP